MASTGEPFGLFWDDDGGDRTYSASSFEYWLKKFFTSGVFEGEMQVQASSGMTLEVGSGYSNVDGKVKFWNAPFNVTLSPANSTYPRIDTVVITRDNVNREIVCEKVTGSYTGDDPVPTAPVRNAEKYQLVIAQILVPAGATEITQSLITDTRPDLDLCGYITGTVQNLDFSQLMAQFETYFEEYKASFEQTMSDWESTQQADYATWFNSIVNQYYSDKADWDAWYADLRQSLHMLPQDSAEYLQIEINELQEEASGSIFNIDTIQPTLIGQAVTITSEDGTESKSATFEAYRNKLENTGISQTIDGITYTVMNDGTVVCNGTATAESRFYINEDFTATTGQKLSGCPADGSAITYQLRVGDVSDDSGVGIDVGSGYTFSAGTYKISINISSGRTVNNLVFSPMVREAADTNEEYEEYSEYVAHAKIVGVTFVGDLNLQATDSQETARYTADVPYFARYHIVMAFWRATVNLQGDTNLYGATITVKNSSDVTVGTVTLSAQDGTGTWYAEGPDTYTFNYTFQGQDYSEELAVTEETTYSLELSAGMSWQLWCTEGDIDSSLYDDLDELLADELAVRKLCTKHASVDYFCQFESISADMETIIHNDLFAKWANLRDYCLDKMIANEIIHDEMDDAGKYELGEWTLVNQIPTMSSNTAPYGEAFSSTPYTSGSSGPAWCAFSYKGSAQLFIGNPNGGSAGEYVGYHHVAPVSAKKIVISFAAYNGFNATVAVQGSHDGSSWVDITETESISSPSYPNVKITTVDFIITDSTAYEYHRVIRKTNTKVDPTSYDYFYVYDFKICIWAPKGNVPIMTSNSAPYGEASSGQTFSNDYASWKAFDGNDSTVAIPCKNDSSGQVNPSYICYKSVNPICVKRIKDFGRGNNKTAILQGSNDGSTWVDLVTYTTVGEHQDYIDVPNNNAYYLYHRIYATPTTTSDYVRYTSIQFYGRELSVSVPTMTSNTAPYGEVSASAVVGSGYEAYKAFDNNDTTLARLATASTSAYVAYKFTQKTSIRKVYWYSDATTATYTVKIGYSDNGIDWTDTDEDYTIVGNAKTWLDVEDCGEHLYWRATRILGTAELGIVYTLQFYGFDYSEKEFEEGTTKKWLYDHGVELEPITAYTDGSNGIAVKHDSELEFGATNTNSVGEMYSPAIDFTDYSLLRAKLGNEILLRFYIEVVSSVPMDYNKYINNTGVITYKGYIFTNSVNINEFKNNLNIDVSSVNQQAYVNMIVGGQSTVTNPKGTISELWLE